METAATRRFNGVVSVEVGLQKDLHLATNAINHPGTECNRLQLQSEAQDQDAGEECALDLLSGTEEKQEDKPEDGLVKEKDRLGRKIAVKTVSPMFVCHKP